MTSKNKLNQPILSIICPLYNEEQVVNHFLSQIDPILKALKLSYEIICINDGSVDQTLTYLIKAKNHYPSIKIISLSRNFGKEAALTAGLDRAKGEAIIPIDCDLQDPPELIKKLVTTWHKGYDVVLARRANRKTDSFIKRFTANIFYKLHNKISTTKIPQNIGDFRLITRKVLLAIQQLPENQRFMKGIFAWVGFKTITIDYERQKRIDGQSKFNGWRLWNFALDGITSFTTLPLRIWLYLGFMISLFAFVYGSFIIIRTLILGIDLPGYVSLLTVILFLGGIQLIGLGIIGEYLGRLYIEAKRRPIYIIEDEY